MCDLFLHCSLPVGVATYYVGLTFCFVFYYGVLSGSSWVLEDYILSRERLGRVEC